MGGRGLSRIAAAIALLAAGSAAAPARSAPLDSHSCAWLFRLSGDQVNAAFPDSAAKYWVAEIPIPPGFHADLAGRFPHARYISFIDYDPASRAIDGIADSEIVPDPGSSNPFVAGADRTASDRSYVVHVRNEVAPASGRATNTIYTERPDQPTKTSRVTQTALVVYRLYEADRAYASVGDITGGVGLPEVSLVADDGSGAQAVPDCDDHSLPDLGITEQLAASGQGAGNDNVPGTKLGGRNPPVWIRYTNAVNGVANGVLNNDRTGDLAKPVIDATNAIPSGGFYENIHNAYMTAFDSAAFGDVLVFHAQAPTTPGTFDDTPLMQSGQLRYWSMCSNMSTTQYLACIKDDDVPFEADHSYTVAVSTAATRPASAAKGCRIAWLPKGPLPSAPIILRNMLPDPSFAQAIQRATQGTERETLGPYYPRGFYFHHAADFDAWANANGGCAGFSWPAVDPQTYSPPGP